MNRLAKKRVLSAGFLVVSLLLALPPAGQARETGQGAANVQVDYASARREMQDFEGVINSLLAQTFTNPFGLVQKPKGVYLPGYGQMFSFLVNIHRAVINTPFGQYTKGEEISPQQKRKRIEDLKDKLMHLLFDRGSGLRQVKENEYITIVAFFEDRNFPDEENQNKTIVLSASKKDLDEYSQKQDQWSEFKQRMKIVEY